MGETYENGGPISIIGVEEIPLIFGMIKARWNCPWPKKGPTSSHWAPESQDAKGG